MHEGGHTRAWRRNEQGEEGGGSEAEPGLRGGVRRGPQNHGRLPHRGGRGACWRPCTAAAPAVTTALAAQGPERERGGVCACQEFDFALPSPQERRSPRPTGSTACTLLGHLTGGRGRRPGATAVGGGLCVMTSMGEVCWLLGVEVCCAACWLAGLGGCGMWGLLPRGTIGLHTLPLRIKQQAC